MKPKSIAGIVCYVDDLNKTAEFYEKLGFRVGSREPDHLTIYLNWFWIDFVAADKEQKSEFQREADSIPKGAGIFVNINVDNVDEFYEGVTEAGLLPSNKPRDWPWGRREFVLRDPDGYKLVFFQKIK